jgi:hypothetical protein
MREETRAIMDFVDWCGCVLAKVVEMMDQATNARAIGVSDHELGSAFFGDAAREGTFSRSREHEALLDALTSLQNLGLVTGKHNRFWKATSMAREYLSDPVPMWEGVCAVKLDTKQDELLRTINRLSHQSTDAYAWVADTDGESIVADLAWASDISLLKTVTQELETYGYIGASITLGTSAATVRYVHATLKSLIWESRRKFTQESREIDQLVVEWETTSVDFKRDVHLDTKDEEAEFAKDILGLANTQASGRRRLVLGFHPKTHEYVGAPNPKLTQDWVERVLINDTEPMVQTRYSIVDFRLGPVGVVEVFRDPTKLPYTVKRSIGDKKRIMQGQVFVRHGSQTEEPTPAELRAIITEGKRARGEPSDETEA